MVNSHEGRKPSISWTRPPDRPRHTWLNLVQEEDANAIPLSSLWRTEIFRGRGAAHRSVRSIHEDDDDVVTSLIKYCCISDCVLSAQVHSWHISLSLYAPIQKARTIWQWLRPVAGPRHLWIVYGWLQYTEIPPFQLYIYTVYVRQLQHKKLSSCSGQNVRGARKQSDFLSPMSSSTALELI